MSSYIATPNGITVYVDSEVYTVNKDHRNFDRIKDAASNKQWDRIPNLINFTKQIAAVIGGKLEGITVERSRIIYQGVAFPATVSEKVLAIRDEGYPIEPMLRFLVKVRENPSAAAQDELFLFCQANGFPIHEDGDLIAYKGVRSDYKDRHTGTIDNSVGQIVSMNRFQVDDRRNVTCSYGLHFAAFDYVKNSYGGARKMVLKINPRDVVSIPSDYNNQKARCCRYEVIAELGKPTVESSESITEPMRTQGVYTDADIQAAAKFKPTANEVRQWIRTKLIDAAGVPADKLTSTQWFKDEDVVFVTVEAAERYGIEGAKLEYKSNGLTLGELERMVFKALGL